MSAAKQKAAESLKAKHEKHRQERIQTEIDAKYTKPLPAREPRVCEGRIVDVPVPDLGDAWVLRSEETIDGWLVYALHVESGAKVPPCQRPTDSPDGERTKLLAMHARLGAERREQHARWMTAQAGETHCPTCGVAHDGRMK